MSFRLAVVFSAMTMFLVYHVAHAQDQSIDPAVEKVSGITPDARMIVDQYLAATGGKEAWRSLQSVQGNGTITIPAASISGTASFCITPEAYRNTFRMSGGKIEDATIISGRNGEVVWQLTGESDQYNGEIIEGAARSKSLRQYQFNQMLDLDANFSRVELADIEEIEGKPAYRLDMVPRENPDAMESRFFDQKTHLIVRTIINGDGPIQESFYGEYVEVGPIMMHTSTKRMAGGVVLMQIDMKNLMVNKPFLAEYSKLPYEIRVLLGEEVVSPPGKNAK